MDACSELQSAYGRIIWSRVAERLPGRTDDQCSRAYEGLVKHNQVWPRADGVWSLCASLCGLGLPCE